ncbi:WD40-repeat-containing domain protein [Podospora aff. communis PSN243]|uniref:WD40-repeat-containing domain protein n=1 Tax=Podospora aff. communis PSN243 TaxID=3040156 RepID=A0AAV9H6G1_9PEZI|nr:WD40-repeat-containing domain protein [Podospora aff. communis PSN243]
MTFSPSTPPKSRLRRRSYTINLPPCPFDSPSDSGYGSGSGSPPSPKERPDGLWMLGDGNQSDFDDPFATKGEHDDMVVEFWDGPETKTKQASKPVTFPVRLARPRPKIPSSFLSGADIRLPRRSSNLGIVRHTTRRQNFPDRFIPSRSDSANAVDKYRMGKDSHELTPSEKLLRHDGASEDAFCYRRRIVTPLAAVYRSHSLSESSPSGNRVGSVLGPLDQNSDRDSGSRQVSRGNVWTVGGVAPSAAAVNNGRGQFLQSGTNARLFRTTFPTARSKAKEDLEKHKARLAEALGVDRTQRILEMHIPRHRSEDARAKLRSKKWDGRTKWDGTRWANEGFVRKRRKLHESRILPSAPFKVLDAPNLRDDFYCSILAYSATCRTLAIGLGDLLYGWSETGGVKLLNPGTAELDCHLTSVAFSSTEGGKGILAYGRNNRTLGLMSLFDSAVQPPSSQSPLPRFELLHPAGVTCLSWKPTPTLRHSKSPINPDVIVMTDDLLVGDEIGRVYYYSVEWPERWEVERDNWAGQMTLLVRIDVHNQQICGLSWSKDGNLFATGGNDNQCLLFETSTIIDFDVSTVSMNNEDPPGEQVTDETEESRPGTPLAAPSGESSEADSAAETEIQRPRSFVHQVRHMRFGDQKHRWLHGAAVKAIAFCPWQDGLVATGGGSNDRCIHFFHTTTGCPLATISVSAQVTSLIWSTTRHEIAATFGYAEPEHPVRIAVFSYPECQQVATISWAGEHRALYAISFPAEPNETRAAANGTRERGRTRAALEGCIVVASSDKSVKFHEVWTTADNQATPGGVGMLGGSDILESLEGIDRDTDGIR